MTANSKGGGKANPGGAPGPGKAAGAAGSEVFSREERQAVIAEINGIVKKNRRQLAAAANAEKSAKKRFKAKKTGGLFPMLVNASALAALAAGLLAIFLFQSAADVQAREGTRVFTDTERALIGEIRRETYALLTAKDREIAAILQSLAGLEAQLRRFAEGEALAAEQIAAQERLIEQQGETRAALAQARQERSRILEEARAQEAALQAQLDARVRELAAAAGRHAEELGEARAELSRLSREQAQTAAIEAQIAGFFALVRVQIAENRFDDADRTMAALREFLDTPAFGALRATQARRELYVQASGALGSLLAGADRDAAAAQAALQGEIAALERMLEERDGAINALDGGAAGAAQRISELQGSLDSRAAEISSLQAERAALQTERATLQTERTALQAERATLSQRVSTLEGNAAAQAQAAEGLRQNVATLEAANAALTSHQAQINQAWNDTRQTFANILGVLGELEAQGSLPPAVWQTLEPFFDN